MVVFLETAENLDWLRKTHLKKENLRGIEVLPDFRYAVLYGNEDCPYRIELFKENNIGFHPMVFELSDSGTFYWLTKMGDFS